MYTYYCRGLGYVIECSEVAHSIFVAMLCSDMTLLASPAL